MKQLLWAVCTWVLCLPVAAIAGEKGGSVPPLTEEHFNAARTVRFRTPAGWTVKTGSGTPELTEARGNGLVLRLLWRPQEVGLDSLHVDCMLIRPAPENLGQPAVDYEYDFVGGALGTRRALDSAFVAHYDEPIEGARDWHQRNVSVVGEGESVCIIGYGPLPAAKKSKPLRKLLDAVMKSVELRPWR
jgi:hypothetical protein